MLNILEGFDVAALGHNSADYLHLLSEAKKLAFADRAAYLADRGSMPAGTLETLIAKDYAARRRTAIDMTRAMVFAPGLAPSEVGPREFSGEARGDTVYLTAADGSGMVVSLIQSLFGSFGAGIVAGDTGITLQNRGAGFVLTPGHPNRIGPRKRPLHTLVPAMLLKTGTPWASFGVMGGDNQAQAHAQVVANLVDFGMDIQEAGEAARVRHQGETLAVERGIGPSVRAALEARGHVVVDGRGAMGGFQGIRIDQSNGVLLGGSDHRKDGLAIGW
jgi:gamma-glutamyltranspeptidase/glutathione hydrolase